VKDRTYFLKKYPKCFVGTEAVTYFLTTHYCNTIPQSLALGQQLMDCDYIHHVTDDHHFKNEHLYYRFRDDDDNYVGPSVAKLLLGGHVTVHSDVDMKGLMFWNKRHVLLEAEEKKIYVYHSHLSSGPSAIINLQQGVLETAECECKSGSFCFTLSDGKLKWVLCAYNSKTQITWLEALSNIGIKFREEEFEPTKETTIYDFTVNDIDGHPLFLDQYRDKVCIVVNVASY